MAAAAFDVMTSQKAKALLKEKGILMPWQDGYEAQLNNRNPDLAKSIEEITAREDKALEDAQVSKIKKAFKSSETTQSVNAQ